MKQGKEIDLEIADNFNVSVGTVDNKNPKSIYINISAWCNPIHNKRIDYNKIISLIKRDIKLYVLDNNINNRFIKEQTIIDFDMRESGIKFNKRSFMNCEITLFQNNQTTPITDKSLITDLLIIINDLFKKVFETSEYFTYYKTKK